MQIEEKIINIIERRLFKEDQEIKNIEFKELPRLDESSFITILFPTFEQTDCIYVTLPTCGLLRRNPRRRPCSCSPAPCGSFSLTLRLTEANVQLKMPPNSPQGLFKSRSDRPPPAVSQIAARIIKHSNAF